MLICTIILHNCQISWWGNNEVMLTKIGILISWYPDYLSYVKVGIVINECGKLTCELRRCPLQVKPRKV